MRARAYVFLFAPQRPKMCSMARKNEPKLTEKAKLLYGDGMWKIRGIPSLKLRPIEMHDGPCGLRIPNDPDSPMDLSNAKPAICYPAPCAIASSWDEGLISTLGSMMGKECAANHTNILLAPGINIKRNPLCGRNFEYLSEDPLIAGKMGAAFVRGLQSEGVGACLKHFACNSQEDHRMVNDSIVDERALHELYLRGFEIAVKEGKPWSLMCSYNKINGVYASDNAELLIHTLKEQWDFDGVVISDWGATFDPILSHAYGLDLEMPCFSKRFNKILRAVRLRRIPRKRFQDSVARMVRLHRRCAGLNVKPFDYTLGHSFAIKAAEKSAVLLKNDGVLPLKSLSGVAVIGEMARTPRFQGGGSSKVNPYKVESFLSAAGSLSSTSGIRFAPGYSLDKKKAVSESLLLDAIDVASSSEKVILFLGLPDAYESEGYDRSNLLLPDDQIRLFDQIYSVNKNIIVVLSCGSPVELPFLSKTQAVLLTYLPGEGGGRAVVNLLLGKACPSGHLTESWPLRGYDVPSFGYFPGQALSSSYRESIYVGYRYYLSAEKPVMFPFGFGLTYARFRYGAPVLSTNSLKPGGVVTVRVKVDNTSKVAGEAVVQLYCEPPRGKVFKPLRHLIGFAKVPLKPGESDTVKIEIPYASFCHYDVDRKAFLAEKGSYAIEVCEDCTSVKAKTMIDIESDAVFESKLAECPAYYNPPKDGFMAYDNDFEFLLGHTVAHKRDPKSRPFTLNSTIEDIAWTRIGRKIIATMRERIGHEQPDAELVEKSILQMPIRSLGMGGVSERMQRVIVDLANAKPLPALFHLIFGGGR